MIRAFNKHYRKAIDLIEDSSTSEKMEIAERVIEWFRELPEEYVISLAMFFNEVIDDLGDDSLEKINLRMKGKKKEVKEEEEDEDEEEEEKEDLEEDEFEEDDYDDEDKEDY
jgi:ABC-type Zn2+ transport system substrate-binding protein/surface adhesin